MRNRLTRLVVLSVAFVALSASMAGATTTNVSRLEPSDPVGAQTEQRPRAALKALGTGGEGIEQVLGSSPAGCNGWSNYPHESGGEVKGLTEIDCSYAVSALLSTAQIWRKRWWGYEKIGDKGTSTNASKSHIKATGYSRIECEDNWYRTSGEHHSYEGGLTYYASTFVNNDVDC